MNNVPSGPFLSNMATMDEERLIAAVRLRPFIFDKNDRNHANRDMVSAAWANIAKEVGDNVTSSECKARWASMRDQFRKKHKEMMSTKSGQAPSKKRKWHLYEFLTFLIPSFSTGASSGNLPKIVNEDENSSASSGDELPQVSTPEISRTSTPTMMQSDQSIEAASKTRPKTARAKSSKKDQLSIVDKAVLQTLTEPDKEIDENEHFFKSLLPAMKDFDTLETLEIRSEIQQLVLRYARAKANRVSLQNLGQDEATSLPATERVRPSPQLRTASASTYSMTQTCRQGGYQQQQPYEEYSKDEYLSSHISKRLLSRDITCI